MITLTDDMTVGELALERRVALDELAESLGLDPGDYSNKKRLAEVIMAADGAKRDAPPVEDETSAPAEAKAAPVLPGSNPAPPTEHKGKYRVLSQIQFMTPANKVRLQLPYVMIPGDPKKGIKSTKRDAFLQCPEDISKEQVHDFFAKGCLAPVYE